MEVIWSRKRRGRWWVVLWCCSYTFQHFASAHSGSSGSHSKCRVQTGTSLLWAEVALLRPCYTDSGSCSHFSGLCWTFSFPPAKALCAGQGGDCTVRAFRCSKHLESRTILRWDKALVRSTCRFGFYLVMCQWEFSSLSEAGISGFMTLTELSLPARGESKYIGNIHLMAL